MDEKYKGYADDTVSSVSDACEESIIRKLEADAGRILRFMASNYLVANPQKTGFLLIRKKKTSTTRSIEIGGKVVEEEECHRILGLTVNNTLSWKDHVIGKGGLLSAVYQRIGALRRIVHHVPKKCLPNIATAIISSKIRYGISVYGTVRLTKDEPLTEECRKLQIALNDAMRVANGSRRRDRVHIVDLVELTGMNTLNRMAAEEMLNLTWQAVHDPNSPLSSSIKKRTNLADDRVSRSASRGDLLNEARTSLGQRNFPESAVRVWNSVALSIRDAPSKYAAKREIARASRNLPL